MNALIGYRDFYECSRHCFTGYDDSVLRAGLNAILVFVILVPGKFVDEVVCLDVYYRMIICLSNDHILFFDRFDDTCFVCRVEGDSMSMLRLLLVLCSLLASCCWKKVCNYRSDRSSNRE